MTMLKQGLCLNIFWEDFGFLLLILESEIFSFNFRRLDEIKVGNVCRIWKEKGGDHRFGPFEDDLLLFGFYELTKI